MKPTIVHIVQHLQPGGIESFALEFQRAAADFYDVHIISLERGDCQNSDSKFSGSAKNVHILDKQAGWQTGIVTEVKQILQRLTPMYVHTHHIGPLIYGGVAARLAGIDCVIHTEHDAWHLTQAKRRILQDICLKLIQPVFVADANFVAEQVSRLLPNTEPYVIANGVDTAQFAPTPVAKQLLRKEAGLPENLRYVGCAARLEAVKSHDVLIDAVSQLPDDIGLLLAGTGSLQESLQKHVRRLGLEKRVFFLGHVEDMRNFYHMLDVFCLSSSNEGLPLSPLEAQACNVPVVLTNVGGCKEAICRETGQVVEPNNPKQLSVALWQRLCKPLQTSPRIFVEKERSIKAMIAQYVTLTQPSLRGKL